MAGPGAGESRITLEAGSSRFVARARLRGPVTASELLRLMPALTEELNAALESVKERESAS